MESVLVKVVSFIAVIVVAICSSASASFVRKTFGSSPDWSSR